MPSLSERSTRGVDGNSDLAIEDSGGLEGFREFWEGIVYGRFVDN